MAHDDAPAELAFPAGHWAQVEEAVAPTTLLAFPALHAVHVIWPEFVVNEPGPQTVHRVAARSDETLPAKHAVHVLEDVAPATLLAVPKGHALADDKAPWVELAHQ